MSETTLEDQTALLLGVKCVQFSDAALQDEWHPVEVRAGWLARLLFPWAPTRTVWVRESAPGVVVKDGVTLVHPQFVNTVRMLLRERRAVQQLREWRP